MLNHPAAIIFDMDGVLANTEPLHEAVERRIWEEQQVRLTHDDFVYGTGGSDYRFFTYICDKYGKSEDVIQTQLECKRALFTQVAEEEGVEPIEGVQELVRFATDRYPCAIASSSRHAVIDAVTTALGLIDILPIHISAEDIPRDRGKPQPDIYLLAAERLDVDPAQCIAIEDSKNGITAAKGAGMTCIAYCAQGSTQDQSAADVIVERMSDIVTML